MLKIIGKLLIFWGSLGSRQMCRGLLHEFEVPKELKDLEF